MEPPHLWLLPFEQEAQGGPFAAAPAQQDRSFSLGVDELDDAAPALLSIVSRETQPYLLVQADRTRSRVHQQTPVPVGKQT